MAQVFDLGQVFLNTQGLLNNKRNRQRQDQLFDAQLAQTQAQQDRRQTLSDLAGTAAQSPTPFSSDAFRQMAATDPQFATNFRKALDTSSGEAGKTRFSNAKNLRDSFIKQSKEFIDSRNAFGMVMASSQDPSAAGDMALIFNFMKVLDPGSTVREGEFAQAASSGAFGERIQAAANRVISGERLSDEIRNDFVSRSRLLFNEQQQNQAKNVDEFRRLSTRFNIDPEDVILDLSRQLDTPENKPKETPKPKIGDQVIDPGALQQRITGTNNTDITQENLEFTAKKHGISVDEVKKRLGIE